MTDKINQQEHEEVDDNFGTNKAVEGLCPGPQVSNTSRAQDTDVHLPVLCKALQSLQVLE